MKRYRLFAFVALGLVLAGCVTVRSSTPITTYLVRGAAMAGPTCPVVQDPPDASCADRPVNGAKLLLIDESGDTASEIVTDPQGRFEVQVPAGRFTLEPQAVEGLLGTAPPQALEAGPGLVVDLLVMYDTGIR